MKRTPKPGELQRAYAMLEVKAASSSEDDERIIEGYATTPTPDSYDDIVEPKGAEFTLPIPLLWQHRSGEPIGHVIDAKVTKDGIWIKAKFVKINEPGKLKDRLDEAWQSVKHGLVKGMSIGFSAIEYSQIEGSYGLRFLRWAWRELSAVTIPANADCSIESIKSIDTETRAALGQSRRGVVRLGTPAGATANPSKQLKGNTVKTIQERIADFLAERAKAVDAMAEIVNKSLETGETLDADAKLKRAELKDRITEIDEHVTMLRESEALMLKTAPAGIRLEEGQNQGTALELRQGSRISVETEKLVKGQAFGRFVQCMVAAKGHASDAERFAKQFYPAMKPLHEIMKAAVGAGATTDSTWAGALVEYNLYSQDFIDYLRPMTILGKFGDNGIPALHAVPFNIEVIRQTSGGSGYWVGQGKPAPLTKTDYDRVQLAFTKLGNIAVLTKEQIRFSNPKADVLVRDAIGKALVAKSDSDFLNPSVAEVANVSPASLTYGVTPSVASGTDADAVRADLAVMMKTFIDANMSLMSGVWVMTANRAMRLSLMRNALGQKEFPDITMLGGRLEGLPVITSQYLPNSVSGGDMVVLLDAEEVYLADDGQVTIDSSDQVSLEMSDAPTQNGVTGAGASMVSTWQSGLIALKAERYINWKKRRSAAVAYCDSVHWGE